MMLAKGTAVRRALFVFGWTTGYAAILSDFSRLAGHLN